MSLLDFYKPLNFGNLIVFATLLIFFDILGEKINDLLLKASEQYKPLRWLWGMGAFVFFWYVLSFILVPSAVNIAVSIILIGLTLGPRYLVKREFQNFLGGWKVWLVPLILMSILIPAIWIKASLPPYQWDELAYHYLSPWAYHHIGLTKLSDGFYDNLPKNYDTLYFLIFSLTKTYSIARLFHFLTYFSMIVFVYNWIKQQTGLISAILFTLVSLYIPGGLLGQATSGYVDVAANSFIFLGVITTLEFLKGRNQLAVPLAFWALALGTRYNSTIPFLSVSVLTLVLGWISRRFRKLTIKEVSSAVIVFIILGGYWYIKNLLWTGNPIFPFMLPCYRFAATCQGIKGYFEGWTYKIDLQTFPTIVYYVLSGSKSLAVITGIVILLATQLKKGYRYLIWFLLAALSIDFLMMKFFSGYLYRYFIYIQYFVFLVIALTLGKVKFVRPQLSWIKWLAVTLAFAFMVRQIPRTLKSIYGPEQLSEHEVNFALGKYTVYDWADYLFPKSGALIKWCDRPEIKDDIPITFYDPDITWYQFEGRFNLFLHKCAITPPPSESSADPKITLKDLRDRKVIFNLISLTPCLGGEVVPDMQESSVALVSRKVSDLLVCNSTPTEIPTLFLFDGNK